MEFFQSLSLQIHAWLGSGYHKAFDNAIVSVAVFVHDAFDARLHSVPASLVESGCLWNNVGQGEGGHFVGPVERMRSRKYVAPVKHSIASVIYVPSLVVVGLVFVSELHVLVIFVLKL